VEQRLEVFWDIYSVQEDKVIIISNHRTRLHEAVHGGHQIQTMIRVGPLVTRQVLETLGVVIVAIRAVLEQELHQASFVIC